MSSTVLNIKGGLPTTHTEEIELQNRDDQQEPPTYSQEPPTCGQESPSSGQGWTYVENPFADLADNNADTPDTPAADTEEGPTPEERHQQAIDQQWASWVAVHYHWDLTFITLGAFFPLFVFLIRLRFLSDEDKLSRRLQIVYSLSCWWLVIFFTVGYIVYTVRLCKHNRTPAEVRKLLDRGSRQPGRLVLSAFMTNLALLSVGLYVILYGDGDYKNKFWRGKCFVFKSCLKPNEGRVFRDCWSAAYEAIYRSNGTIMEADLGGGMDEMYERAYKRCLKLAESIA